MRVEIKRGIDQTVSWFRQVVAEHVFQTFEVLKAVETAERRQFYVQAIKRPWRILTALPQFEYYSVWEDGRLMLLAPFKIQRNVAHVLGDGCEINYCDFLMGDISHEVQKKAMRCLFNELKKRGVCAIVFTHLARTSRVWTVLQELDVSLEGVHTSKSVCIDFKGNDHASYFSSLGKHARQNVRTAYNRLVRDAHTIELKLFSNCGHWFALNSCEGRAALDLCHQMYLERQSHVYGLRGGVSMFIHKYANYSTLSANGPNAFMGLLLIDGKPAASMEGYYNQQGRTIELPRLSINEEFGWYSPGLILLNESIKRFISGGDVSSIDLTRGTEKYKFDMGGTEYDTMIFKVKL